MITHESTREEVLAAVRQDGRELRYVSEEWQGDREVVLAAVMKDGRAFKYALENLRADREFVLTAVQQNGLALEDASPALKADRDVVLAAVKRNGLALEFASEELKGDKDVVTAAVQQYGYALKDASPELKADKDFVLTAVQRNVCALQFASEDLREDTDVVLAALHNDSPYGGRLIDYINKSSTKYTTDGSRTDNFFTKLYNTSNMGYNVYSNLIDPIIKAINKIEDVDTKYKELQFFLSPTIEQAIKNNDVNYYQKLITSISAREMEVADRLDIIGADTIQFAQQQQGQESSRLLIEYVNSLKGEDFVQERLAQQQPAKEPLLEALSVIDDGPQSHDDMQLAGAFAEEEHD